MAAQNLREQCPGVYDVLATERERFMALQIIARKVPGADVLVFCTPDRAAALRDLLSSVCPVKETLGTPEEIKAAGKESKIWPFLLILVYAVLPLYGSILV